MSDLRLMIQKPIITEKSTELKEANNRYIFKVDLRANKRQIKKAVEDLFNVRVKHVTTAVYRGKPRVVTNKSGRFTGKTPNWKKAYVTVAEGDSIDIFDVV
ncbi:MAG: 50S ribosomal protein L23 [Candidatus Krumholzibacteria bacterium]|nr:50S ribosomal protein L23 [Candidatus Krumholzibacteria bacterium]